MTSKTRKSRIDQIRDGASSMIVGDDTDGAIKGMVSVADQYLYVIKEHAIYRVLLADEIDPERTRRCLHSGEPCHGTGDHDEGSE